MNSKGIKTSEFWTMIGATVVSLGIAFGLVKPEANSDVSSAIQNIIVSVMTIAPSISYMISRTWLKAKTGDEVKKN